MRLRIKEILSERKMSVKAFSELMPNHNPSYRTIDEFMRRGGGTLVTAAAIADALNVGIDDIYVKDDYVSAAVEIEPEEPREQDAVSKIVDLVTCAKYDAQPPLLSMIALALGSSGYEHEAVLCFEYASTLLHTDIENVKDEPENIGQEDSEQGGGRNEKRDAKREGKAERSAVGGES